MTDSTAVKLTVQLPWPAQALWPNRANGRNWRVAHGARSSAYAIAWGVACDVLSGERPVMPDGEIAIRWTFYPPTRRRFDLDGALSACKAYGDAIAKALGCDDYLFAPVTLARGPVVPDGMVIVEIGL